MIGSGTGHPYVPFDDVGRFSDIYYFGVSYWNDFVEYLFRFVYEDGMKAVVLRWSVALFIFMLFLYFIVGFLFVRFRK